MEKASSGATLIIECSLPGSGKTTHAKQETERRRHAQKARLNPPGNVKIMRHPPSHADRHRSMVPTSLPVDGSGQALDASRFKVRLVQGIAVYCPPAPMQADLTIRSYELTDLTGVNLDKLSDEELFTCLKAGHHDALAILFRRYHLIVLKIARNILRDSAEAEDLMQAVFLELFETAAHFDPTKGTSKRWIIRYAYHRSLNRKQYLNARVLPGVDVRDKARRWFGNGGR